MGHPFNPIVSLYNKEGLPASPFRTWTDPPPKDYKDFAKPKTELESETNPTGREKETFR
jgi:ABC-type Fe3+ transport system substrate-binding protein